MKFILTKELGRLAKWLRILGFDSVYFNQDNLSSLVIQALKDERIILTKNQRLSRPAGIKIVLLKTEKIKEQLAEVLKELRIQPASDMMFSRCVICNEELAAIDKKKVKDRVAEYVFKTQEDFRICVKCNRIYWQGTHWGNASKILKEIDRS